MEFTSEQIEAYRAAKHGQRQQLAVEWGIAYNSLRGAMSRLGWPEEAVADSPSNVITWEEVRDRAGLSADRLALAQCPPPITIVEEPKPLKLDRFLYQSDAHCPLHDDKWIERLVRVGYHEEIADLIIGGDFFDNDSLSAHPADLPQLDLNKAIEVSGQVLRYIKQHFERIHILPGNHCRRMARQLNKNLSFANFVRMAIGNLDGFNVTEHDFFLINESTPERPGWAVGHPRFFAAYPTKGLDAVAMQRQRNVIGAHSHTLGAAKIGKFWCISPGMMMRPDLTPYLVRQNGLSKHADQSSGFVLVDCTPKSGDIFRLFADGTVFWPDYQ